MASSAVVVVEVYEQYSHTWRKYSGQPFRGEFVDYKFSRQILCEQHLGYKYSGRAAPQLFYG